MAGLRFFGIAGTGGASSALGTGWDLDGDGSRNVLSVIDPALPRRCSAAPGGPRTDPDLELPIEDDESARRIVLLVWTSATDVGVVGRFRSAAAAAAEDNDAFDALLERKAAVAAVVAAE